MSDRPAVETLVREARVALRVKKNPVRALELLTAAEALLADVSTDAAQRADIYAAASSLWLDLGDEQRSDKWIVEAIEADGQVIPARPIIHGTHKLFYAKLLYAQQRFADAARQASEGLAMYAEGVQPDDPEPARVRADVAPILRRVDSPD